jgi:hypothetical protein
MSSQHARTCSPYLKPHKGICLIPHSVSAALQRLAKGPEVFKQLDRFAATTARLALADRTQLSDVWDAIDALRVGLDSFLTKESTADTGSLPAARGSSSIVRSVAP